MLQLLEKQTESLIKTELSQIEPANFEIRSKAFIHLATWSPQKCVYIYGSLLASLLFTESNRNLERIKH